MNHVETLLFVLRMFGNFGSPVAWMIGLGVFLISFFGLGLGWGLLWNKKWGFLNQLPMAAGSLLIALGLATAVLAHRSAGDVNRWLDAGAMLVAERLSGSPDVNRAILRNAWEQIHPRGGQQGLEEPSMGGNRLRLNDQEDARALAAAAAGTARGRILAEGPFALGAPATLRNDGLVADDVSAVITDVIYPVEVSPDNSWSKAAVASQVAAGADSARAALRRPLAELRTVLLWLGVVLGLLQVGLVALAASRDIRENP